MDSVLDGDVMTDKNEAREPFVTIFFRENDTLHSKEVPIRELSDEDLLSEYAGEVDGETRRCSGDPPSKAYELSDEILKRMAAAALTQERDALRRIIEKAGILVPSIKIDCALGISAPKAAAEESQPK